MASRQRRRRRVLAPPQVVEAPEPVATVAAGHCSTRQECTCAAVAETQGVPCTACTAWGKHQVLLENGTTIPVTVWLLAQEPRAPGEN